MLILWRIWKRQIAMVFSGNAVDPKKAVYMAVNEAKEFIEANRDDSSGMPNPGNLIAQWKPPPTGKLKVNVDGALMVGGTAEKMGAAGIVIKNYLGYFVAARSIRLGVAESTLCAEALAWRAALECAQVLGLQSIMIEGDSNQLVQILGNKVSCPIGIEVIVEDSRRDTDWFRCCEITFV